MPYDPGKGALAKRYCVGNRLFTEGKWYRFPALWAERLADLKQSTGVPYFQVVTPTEQRRIYQTEIAVAYARAGHAMPVEAVPVPKVIAPPKDGQLKGKFDDLPAAEELDPRGLGVPAVDPPVPDSPDAQVEAGPDLENMSRAQLLLTAKEWDIEVNSRMTKAELQDKIRTELYGGGEEN